MKIIPLGIDAAHFKPPNSKSKAKQAIGIPADKFVIGYCGRIAREKDLGTLYAAFKTIHEIFPSTILLIVGEGLHVPNLPALIHTGRQEDVRPYLQAMDTYVLPSLTETSSLSTMEAMATGLPVVVTPVGSLPDYVTDSRNGRFFPMRNHETLAKILSSLITNKQQRKKLGRNARTTIVKHRTWEKTVKELKKALTSLN